MAGTIEGDEDCSSFQWDETSQLYFHASSGFYHDPNAGWYYNSRDGLYYKFENGNYVLLENNDQSGRSEVYEDGNTVANSSLQDDSCTHAPCDKEVNCDPFKGRESVANEAETTRDEPSADDTECINGELPESLPPPSEWLEDTLIELYLAGYSNPAMNADSDDRMIVARDNEDSLNLSIDGNDSSIVQEEGERVPDDSNAVDASGISLEEGAYQDEETWRSQYGQVIESDEELSPAFPVVDLWDWTMVRGAKKDGKGEVYRLVGRLVRKSVKLHPSMSANGALLKTAPICKVHRDLVQVTSGQVYKLRTPSAEHLTSLTSYDSSNPTKDWGFAKLSIDGSIQRLPKSCKRLDCEMVEGVVVHKYVPTKQLHVSPKNNGHAYRDRAAERRALHGSFGVGPGEKKAKLNSDSLPSSPDSASTEASAAETLNISFGAGSYAKRIMENMGWKEGEALGSSTKGLTEPLQAVGNKGNAGLGWDHRRKLL